MFSKYFKPPLYKFERLLWMVVYLLFFRPFAGKIFSFWRNFLLSIFGAKIGKKSGVYSTARIWLPRNLQLGSNSWIGPNVNCYNVTKIELGDNVTISQNTHLCSASHEYESKDFDLIYKSIIIEDNVWVGADSFISMGVTLQSNCVVGARSVVVKTVSKDQIVGGNPARLLKFRKGYANN